MKKFAYLFTINGKIVWSAETAETLSNRVVQEPTAVQATVKEFIETAPAGHHIELPTGEFIFCTNGGVKAKTRYPKCKLF